MSATYSEENLIENVRAHTSLYDIFSEDYRDQNVRKEAWEEIGDALKIPGIADKCKSEWTKLRNCFLNSIRRRRQKTSGQSAKHIPAWKFSKQMEFLLPFLENRETHSNIEVHNQDARLSDMPELPESQRDQLLSPELHESQRDPLLSLELPESQKDQMSSIQLDHSLLTAQKAPTKRKKSNYNEEMVEIMRANSNFRREKYEKKAYMNHDEVEMFYLSMAKIAKRLPKAKEAKLRMEICNKVSEAELAHLLEVETIQQPQVSNQNQVLSYKNIMHHQNLPSVLQPPISTLHVVDSNSRSSPSTYSDYSDQSIGTTYSNEEQNYRLPPLNNFMQPNFDHSNKYIDKNSSNKYKAL